MAIQGTEGGDYGDLARALRGSSDWRAEQALVEVAVTRRPSEALTVAAALDAELRSNGYDHAVHSLRRALFDHVVGVPSADATAVAIELILTPGPLPPSPPRRTDPFALARRAMHLARTRPAAELLAAIGPGTPVRARQPELGLLIAHELVLDGEEGGLDDWLIAWSRSASHPLAILPPVLLDLERGFGFWRPTFRGGMTGYSRAAATVRGEPPLPLATLLPSLGPPLPIDRQRIAAPFQDWIERSNGEVMVRAFARGGGFGDTTPVMGEPPLGPDLPGIEIGVADGLRVLFSSAVSGGAYSYGQGGAFARLRTWEAVAGILGRPWPSPIDGLADGISRSRWIALQTDEPWFSLVAWDVFLAVELDDRIVTIAATDND